MNLKEIIESTRRYNFHSHTHFCDGRRPMEEMVRAAVDAGLEHYGFTAHSPLPIPSGCNMSALAVDDYVAEFHRLQNLYGECIHLYLSMEIDCLGEKWGASHSYFDALPLDYRLSSVHFIPAPDGVKEIDVDGQPAQFCDKMRRYFDGDIRWVVDKFYERTQQMISAGGFDILGHFDKIGSNAAAFQPGIEDEPWYRRHIDDVIDAVKARPKLIVEINTKAYPAPVGASAEAVKAYIPRLYPSAPTIRRLVSAGVTLAVNSDAHYPERITAGRDVAFDIIESVSRH